jgi:sialate O-acetylesterase
VRGWRTFGVLLVCAVAAVLAADLWAAADAIPPPSVIFVLAGQSNMIGRGKMDGVVPTPTNPNLLIMHNEWEIAEDPLGPRGEDDSAIGPGMTLGRRVLEVRPSMRIGLFMCAKQGTSINQWQPNMGPYKNCVSKVRATGIPVAGIFFLQGETDAKNRAKAEQWKSRFLKMLAQFRKDLGKNVPFVLGQIGRLIGNYKAQGIVRNAQTDAAKEKGLPLVVSSDLAVDPKDGAHFTTDSYRILGVAP